MKICHIYNYPARYREEIYSLLDENFDSTFIFGNERTSVKRMDTSILKNVVNRKYIYLGRIRYQKRMLGYLFKPYDIYIIGTMTDNFTYWLFLVFLKLFSKKRIYIWSHGYYGNETKKQLFVKKTYFKLAQGVFVYGNYSRDLMIKNGFDPNRIFTIYNSLHYTQQLKLRKIQVATRIYTHHFGNDNPTIIMIGRLNLRKKLSMLIDAVSTLQSRNFYLNVVLIGEGEDREQLEEDVRRKGIDKYVWFYGACYDEAQNAELIFNADLCVVPGDVGLTAIHSLMFGCPCLTHNYWPTQGPEFEAIKEGLTGSFFEHNDPMDLTKKLEAWFTDHTNDRNTIRENCFNEIDSRWNPYNQINIFKTVFENK